MKKNTFLVLKNSPKIVNCLNKTYNLLAQPQSPVCY